MVVFYDEIMLLHEVMAPLVGIQKKMKEVLKLFKVTNKVIDLIQEWVVKYPEVLQQLIKKYRVVANMDRVHLRLHS